MNPTRALAVPVLVLALTGPALAARRPTATQRRAIVAALSRATATRGRRILLVRIATVAPGWAFARLEGPDDAILRRRGGRWRVALVGGLGLGCRVPYDVRRDFRLIC